MSKNQSKKTAVPKQEKGVKSDTSHSVELKTHKEAEDLFDLAKNRLLDVSNWHQLCGLVTASFTLADNSGNEVKRLAKEGDYLKINVPGPGSKAGDGYDWVRIEAIEDKNNEATDYEEVSMRVRPAKNPTNNAEETAHFFKDAASSTFIVVREVSIVRAEVHGRNEVPNVEQETKLDTIRNGFIALGAMLGFSKTQWKQLVKGLVSLKKLR